MEDKTLTLAEAEAQQSRKAIRSIKVALRLKPSSADRPLTAATDHRGAATVRFLAQIAFCDSQSVFCVWLSEMMIIIGEGGGVEEREIGDLKMEAFLEVTVVFVGGNWASSFYWRIWGFTPR